MTHTQTRLKSFCAEDRENCHQMVWQRFGSKPLTPSALRILTDTSNTSGIPDRRNLASRAGIGNSTYLSMTKGTKALQTRMRRNMLPTHFGPGTGYKTFENTMPWRDLLRDDTLRKEFEASGCLRSRDVAEGPPRASPAPRPPSAPETMESTDVVTGRGLGPNAGSKGARAYTFKASTWRPSTASMDALPPRVPQAPPGDQARPATAPEGQSRRSTPRRPMTPAGSSPLATALRQLEGDHRVKNGYFRPGTGSRDPAQYKDFRPSRGNVLMVFNEMDDDLNGKVTKTEFVNIMIDVGCTEAQAIETFRR